MIFNTFLFICLGVIGVNAYDPSVRLTKPVLVNSLDYLEAGLEANLVRTNYTLTQWAHGAIPEQCKTISTGKVFSNVNYNPSDFEVYNVQYTDCGYPWVFCHHKASNVTIDVMASQFGQIPIQMRQYVRHVVDVPGEFGWAFEYDNSVTFIRPIQGMLTAMIHEIGHALDHGGAFYRDTSLSKSDNWWNNYLLDTKVSDPYAQTNAIEDVAQTTVIGVYNVNVPGYYESIEPGWRDIFHQYATLITVARESGNGTSILKSGSGQICGQRLQSSKPVPMNEASFNRFQMGAIPKLAFPSDISAIDTPSSEREVSNCGLRW